MFQTVQSLAEKAAFVLVILFGVLLPYEMLYATVVIYPLILCTLIAFRKEKIKRVPKTWWIFTLIILLNMIGYFYSTDMGRAGYLLERQMVIFVFPIILPLAIDIDRKKINIILGFFTISCVAALLFLFYNSYAYLVANHLPYSDLMLPLFYNHKFTAPIGIHATYLALYVSLSICFLLSILINVSILKKMGISLVILFLCLGLFFLASRNTILATIFVMLFVFPFYSIRHKMRFFGMVFLAIVLFLFVGEKMNYMNERFTSELIDDINPNETYSLENSEPRIMRWECAVEIIKKRPFFGYGSGDEIPKLMELYKTKNMKVSYSQMFNTHNQYLSILIKNGFAGLVIFLAMFLFFFVQAFRAGDFLYLALLLLLVIGFFTENIIDANKGIFFFAFFNTLLGYNALKENKTIIKNQQ